MSKRIIWLEYNPSHCGLNQCLEAWVGSRAAWYTLREESWEGETGSQDDEGSGNDPDCQALCIEFDEFGEGAEEASDFEGEEETELKQQD